MAISGLDFQNIYVASGAASSNVQSGLGQSGKDQNIFMQPTSGIGFTGPTGGVNSAQGQSNLGLVSKLDNMDSGPLSNPELRDDEHGKYLYCFA